MPIQIACPKCHYESLVPDHLVGTSISCPQCEGVCPVRRETEARQSASSPEGTKSCPFCGKTIVNEARKCRYCRSIVSQTFRRAKEAKRRISDQEYRQNLRLKQAHIRARNGLLLSLVAILTAFIPAFSPIDLHFETFDRKTVLSFLFAFIYPGASAGVFLISFGARREFSELNAPESDFVRFSLGLGLISVLLGMFFLLYLKYMNAQPEPFLG